MFHNEPHYPWDSQQADLAAARHLITKHGYQRRAQELENLEQIILLGGSHAGQ